MRRRRTWPPVLVAALLSGAASGGADEPDGGNLLSGDGNGDGDAGPAPEISFEDPLSGYVVVTGVKRRQRTTAALATISILTVDQIQAVPYLFLGDLLGMLPGVDARWGMMQRYYVGLRGLGSTTALNSRALLLWDGVPMNDPFTGELSAGHFVPLVGVERIEAIRGAASTMYGANAFSGVVNVVTRDPTELVPREGTSASLLMGSFLTSRLQARADQNLRGTHVGASVEGFTTDGPFPRMQRTTPLGLTEFKNDAVDSVAGEVHVARAGVQLRAQYVYGERGRPGTFIADSLGHLRSCDNCHSPTEWGQGEKYPATAHSCGNCHAAPWDRETVQRGNVALLYDRPLGSGIKTSVRAYHNEYRTRYRTMREDDFLTMTEERIDLGQRASGAEVHLAHSLRERNHFLVGADLRRTSAASQMLLTPGGDDHADFVNVGAFAENELGLGSRIAITGGARVDASDDFDTSVSPRAGVVLRPLERLSLRVQGARAFRNPSLSELYVLERRGRYTVRGNPDLQPEWMTSLETGASYSFAPRDRFLVRLAGVGYRNQVTDLISIAGTSGDTATFVNLDPVVIHGVELESEVELQGEPRMKAFANGSLQHARDRDGDTLAYAPGLKGNLGFHASRGGWGFLARLRVVGPRTDDMRIQLPGFATLDVSAQADVGHRMLLQLWINNLGDEDAQESLGIPRAGRSFFLTLGVRD